MKKMKKLLLSITLLSFSISAQILDSATAIIPFDGSLDEVISHTTPISNNDFTFIDDRLGNANSAVKLNSRFIYGNPEFARMDTSDFSLCFWFRKDGDLGFECGVVQKKAEYESPNLFHEEYGIGYQDWIGDGTLRAHFKPTSDSSGIHRSMGGPPESEWAHIALTIDRNGFLKTYIDAEFINEEYIGNLESFSANIDSADLIIGAPNMSIDNIYFFKKALTPNEINEIYNFSSSVSIDQIYTNEETVLTLYPNPSNGKVEVNIEALNKKDFTSKVYNFRGDLLIEQVHFAPSNKLLLDLSEYSRGYYFLVLETEQTRFHGKIVLD
jgi:hypothetical protein